MKNRINFHKAAWVRLLFVGIVFFAMAGTGYCMCELCEDPDIGNCPCCGICYCGMQGTCECTTCPGNCAGDFCGGCPLHKTCTCDPNVHNYVGHICQTCGNISPCEDTSNDCLCDTCGAEACVPGSDGICVKCGDPLSDQRKENLKVEFENFKNSHPKYADDERFGFSAYKQMRVGHAISVRNGCWTGDFDSYFSECDTLYEDFKTACEEIGMECPISFNDYIGIFVESTLDPINVLTGELYFTESDLSVPAAGIPLVFERYYSSLSGWRHSYDWEFKVVVEDEKDMRMVKEFSDYTVWKELSQTVFTNSTSDFAEDLSQVLVKTGQGADYYFEESDTEPGVFYSESTDWMVVFEEVVESGETNGYRFVLHQPGGIEYTFGGSQLDSIEDAWGNRVDLTYSSNSLLVAHSCGTSLLLEHADDPKRPTRAYVSAELYVDYAYDSHGNLTNTVRHINGETFEFTYQYDADGVMTNKTNPRGDEYRFTQSLAAASGETNRTTTLEIGDGWIKHEVDAHWGTASGEPFRHSNVTYDYGDGLEKKYRYETTNDMIQAAYGPYTNIAEKLETGTEYTYDRKNVATEKTFDSNTGFDFTIHKQYDTNNHVTAVGVSFDSTNPVWQTRIAYDPVWNLPSATTNAEGHWTQTTYTKGLPLALKAFWSDTQSYDTTFGYYSNGLVKAVTNANLHATRMEYDANGNLSLVEPPASPQVSTLYDSLGHLESSEVLAEDGSSTGRITEYDVTAKGWIKSVTYPDGLQATFAYDNAGNTTNSTDRAGRKTAYAYAPTKKLTSVTQYLSEGGTNTPVTVSYCFDKMFNSLSITNPSTDAVETYQLDIQDRVTEITNIEGQSMSIEYLVGDFVGKITRFDQSTISNQYDNVGQLTNATYSGGTAIAYSYWLDGETKTVSDGFSSITNAYDRLNRLTNQVIQIGNLQSEIDNAFDPVGNVTNTVVSAGGTTPSSSYTYDAAERLTDILHHEGTETQKFVYAYSPVNGMVVSVSNTVSGITCSYEYDLMDRVTNIVYETGSGSLIRGLEYEYDAVGMITEKKIADNASANSTAYLYDSLDRLVYESQSGSVSSAYSVVYSYDLAGNRTSKTSNGWKTTYTLGDGNRLASTSAQAATNTLFVSGSADELIGTDPLWGEIWITNLTTGAGAIPSVNGSTFFAEVPALGGQTNTLHVAIPDKAGNMGYTTNDFWVPSVSGGVPASASYAYNATGCLTNLNGVSLGWDERYRLKSVDDASSFVEYEYDVLNRRASRIEGSSTNYFVYNGNQVVADLDGSGNLLRTYVWGTGIDNLLSMTTYGATATNRYYAIKDHQNTVLALVDATGSVVESYEYDAYGNTKVFNASGTELTESAIGNRYTFQGREIDWATGLYYFRARWYNPVSGRWLSKDPIGIAGGLNLYVFVSNNPVNFIDPFGRKADVMFMPDTDSLYDDAMAIPDAGASEITVAGHGDLTTYNQGETYVTYYKGSEESRENMLTPQKVANAIKALSDYDPKAIVYVYICYGNLKGTYSEAFNKELAKLLPNPIRGHDDQFTFLFPKKSMKCPNE